MKSWQADFTLNLPKPELNKKNITTNCFYQPFQILDSFGNY